MIVFLLHMRVTHGEKATRECARKRAMIYARHDVYAMPFFTLIFRHAYTPFTFFDGYFADAARLISASFRRLRFAISSIVDADFLHARHRLHTSPSYAMPSLLQGLLRFSLTRLFFM